MFQQTITGAMSTLCPPVHLEDAYNKYKVDYIQDKASQPDFDYPAVSVHAFFILFVLSNLIILFFLHVHFSAVCV